MPLETNWINVLARRWTFVVSENFFIVTLMFSSPSILSILRQCKTNVLFTSILDNSRNTRSLIHLLRLKWFNGFNWGFTYQCIRPIFDLVPTTFRGNYDGKSYWNFSPIILLVWSKVILLILTCKFISLLVKTFCIILLYTGILELSRDRHEHL